MSRVYSLAGAGMMAVLACGGQQGGQGEGEGDGDEAVRALPAEPAITQVGQASSLPEPSPESRAAMPAKAEDVPQRPSEVARGVLPDLVLDAAYLIDSTRFDTQRIEDDCAVQQGCATGLGERRVVRFGSRMGNIGSADFVLGVPEAQNPLWSVDTCQGTPSLPGFARYELNDAQTGERVLVGTKNEFCITDAEEWIPESGAECHSYTCTRQGIRPGCADNYGTEPALPVGGRHGCPARQL